MTRQRFQRNRWETPRHRKSGRIHQMAAALFGNSQNSGDGGGLNAIAAERAKLAAFTDRKGFGKRGRLTIGLICSLSS